MGVIDHDSHTDFFISNKEFLFRTLDPEHPIKLIPGIQLGGFSTEFCTPKKFGYWDHNYETGENNFLYEDLKYLSDFDTERSLLDNHEVFPVFCLITGVKKIEDTDDVEVKFYTYLNGISQFTYQIPEFEFHKNDGRIDGLTINPAYSKQFINNWKYLSYEPEYLNDYIAKEDADLKLYLEDSLVDMEYSVIMSKREADDLGITIYDFDYSPVTNFDVWKLNGSFKYPITLRLGARFEHKTDDITFIIPDITEVSYPVNFYIYPYEDLDYIVEADEINEIPESGGSAVNCCDDILSKIDELKESINNNTEDIKNTIKEGGQGGGLDDETKCKINRIDANIMSLRDMIR